MEKHGTDDLDRLRRLENRHEQTERDIRALSEQTASLAASVTVFKDAVESSMAKLVEATSRLDQRVSEVRERRTDWGTIATFLGVVFIVGGMALAPIIRDIDRITRNVEFMRSDFVSAEDYERDMGRVRDEIQRERERIDGEH